MQISFEFDPAEKITQIHAVPGEYDAPVLNPLRIYSTPLLVNHDRLHVAAALLFHEKLSGTLDLGPEHSCSRHVAIQIARFFDPVDLFVMHQTLEPRAIPKGAYVTALGFRIGDDELPLSFDIGKGEAALRFVPEAVGGLFSEFEVAIGANIAHGLGDPDTAVGDLIHVLGAGVLFAEDFQVSGFRLPGTWAGDASRDMLVKTGELLSSVALSLEWEQ